MIITEEIVIQEHNGVCVCICFYKCMNISPGKRIITLHLSPADVCVGDAECWHDKSPLHVYFSSTISLMMVKSEHTYTHTGHCIHIKVKKLFAGVTQN